MERLRELYDNFPKELRYILDGRIEDLLDTLPPLDIRFEKSKFKVKTSINIDVPIQEQNVTTNNGIGEKFHDEISDVIVLSSKDGKIYKLAKENKIPPEAAEISRSVEKIAEKFDSTPCLLAKGPCFLAKGYNPVVPEIISHESVRTDEN